MSEVLLSSELDAFASKANYGPHDSAPLLNKEGITQVAQRLHAVVKHVIDDDDAICTAFHDNLTAVLASAQGVLDEAVVIQRTTPKLDEEEKALRPRDKQKLIARRNALLHVRDRLRDVVDRSEAANEALLFSTMVAHVDGQLSAIGLARWAENAFPQVTMGHKYCAALLCTGISEEVLEHVRAPWDAFFIEVPDGILAVDSEVLKQRVPIRRILVTRHKHKVRGECWAYQAMTDTPLTIWRFGVSTAQLLPPELEGDIAHSAMWHGEDFTDEDKRISALVGRLVVNTCLAMSDPKRVKKVGPGHKTGSGVKSREDKKPLMRTFQVGEPINIDLRDMVASFIDRGNGGKLPPSVQVLVRGFWRIQHHGPKNSLTKTIFVSPFWRGRADAPILVRSHDIKPK